MALVKSMIKNIFKKKVKNNDEVIIYWCVSDRYYKDNNDIIQNQYNGNIIPFMLNVTEPVSIFPLLKAFRDKINPSGNNSGNILMCPAIHSYAKNTFYIKSPVNIDFDFRNNQMYTENLNQSFFNAHIEVHDAATGFFQLKIPYYFFTEDETLVARQSSIQYTGTEIEEKFHTIGGEFDIGKWFRPFSAAFVAKKTNCKVKIRKDDPLFFMEFFTNKKIVFKQFSFDEELINYANYCVSYKQLNSKVPLVNNLRNIYNIFVASNIKSKILKSIKNNLFD